VRRIVLLPVIALLLVVSASGGLASGASNTVTAGRLSRNAESITASKLAPAVCSSIGTLNGNGGADCMVGGAGADTLNGGAGTDVLFGRAGNDTLSGGNGNDLLYGGLGTDSLSGNNNTDHCDRGTDALGTFATCETTSSVGPD
jgi:Ca2+-binding RTX toxin-like protein